MNNVYVYIMNNVYVYIMMTSISEQSAFPRGIWQALKIHILGPYLWLTAELKISKGQLLFCFVFIYLSQLVRLFIHFITEASECDLLYCPVQLEILRKNREYVRYYLSKIRTKFHSTFSFKDLWPGIVGPCYQKQRMNA